MGVSPSVNEKRKYSMKDQSNQIVDTWRALFLNFFIIFCIALTVFMIFTTLQWFVEHTFLYVLTYFHDEVPHHVHSEQVAKSSGPIALFISLMLGAIFRTLLTRNENWRDARGDGASDALKYFYSTYYASKKEDVISKRYQRPTFSAALRRALVTYLTIGCGGSGGLEGPAIPVGEAMGAGWSKIFNVQWAPDLRLFQMAGISAGICALLDMPFMAALFAAEIVYSDKMIYRSLHFSLFSSFIVYFFNTHLIHIRPLFTNVAHTFKYTPIEYVEVALFAILVCAPSGIIVKWVIAWLRSVMEKVPFLYRGPIGALAMFVIAMVAWFGFNISPEHTLGMGEHTLVALFDNQADPILQVWWVLLILMVVKLLTTAFTLGCGGSAGLFIPAMFMGGVSAASIYYLLVELGIPLTGGGPDLIMVAGICVALVSVVGVPIAAFAFAFEGFGAEFGPPAIISVVSCYFFLERVRKDWL